MNDKSIAKAFGQHRLNLRPQALESIKQLVGQYLTQELLTQIAQMAYDLQVNNDIVEIDHIKQIVDMLFEGKNTTNKDQTLFKIQESINNSLIFIDPFEIITQQKHKFIINCSPQDKWIMPIKRLQHIENILKTGNYFVFGISSLEKITISSVGSIPSSTEIIRVLGLIIQIDRNYFISDGQLKQKLNISSATNGNIFQGNKQTGLINIGSVVLLTGLWDDISGQFIVFQFSQPYFDIKRQGKQDLKTLLEEDKFGIIQKTKNNISYLFNDTLTLQQQQALEFYKINTNLVRMYFISNFSIDNLSTIQRLEQMLLKSKTFQPTMIFLFGKFTQESIPNQNKVYGPELLSIINQYNKCLFFFVPSFDDFPLAYSMPHPPINLYLYFKQDDLPANMHSLSNPMRLSINGVRIVIIKNDISREMRKQHLLNEISDYTQVSETIISQQYLGTFHSDQTAYKWNYDQSLILDPSTEFVILCDQTLPQFIHQTQNGTFVINPGDFNAKGYFCTMNKGKDGFKAQTCQFL